MMSDSDFRVLRDLIAEDVLVAATIDKHGRDILVLEEDRPEADDNSQGGYSVVVQRVPKEIVAIRADCFPKPSFKGTRGERKRADFIIVAETERTRKNWIIYIELKGSNKSRNKIERQLKGAQCLLAYCRAIGRTFWQQAGFLDDATYRQRFVSVARISVNKRPTRHRPAAAVHDSPENMLRIGSPPKNALRFQQLTGRDG